MKLNSHRISRYLSLQKQVNDYLLKLSSKNRDNLVSLTGIQHCALNLEEKMRNLLENLSKEGL